MIGDAEVRGLILSVLVFTAGTVVASMSALIALNVLAEMIVNPPQDKNTAIQLQALAPVPASQDNTSPP